MLLKTLGAVASVAALTVVASPAQAAPLLQYASSLTGFSSQYSAGN